MNTVSSIWNWLGSHATAVKLGSVGAALLLLVGGLFLGVKRAQPTAVAPLAPAGSTPTAELERVRVLTTRHSVIGTVRSIQPGHFLVRNARGVPFRIQWGAYTRFGQNGHKIAPTAIRPGDRLIVLGTTMPNGSLRATFVSVIGHASLPTPKQTSPTATPPSSMPLASPNASPRSLRPLPSSSPTPTR
ncbi:MAG: hypothetical protein ACR2PL_14040 [Dehalococcoidia bacterium]